MSKNEVVVKDINIRYKTINKEDYISLTDIAKFYNSQDPSGVIRNWMSNKDSFDFYAIYGKNCTTQILIPWKCTELKMKKLAIIVLL